MSVIIRLQNLPWSANALDIRTFFRGLSIPEGGVHIVGGEQGDAFIAFSTDEDARQAMMLNGGKIKEIQVQLLLSSRSEMHKVIETARQTVPILALTAPAPTPIPAPAPVHIQPPIIPQVTPFSATLNSNPLANFGIPGLGNPQEIPQPAVIEPPAPLISPNQTDNSQDDKEDSDDRKRNKERERRRTRSRSRDRRDRKRDRRDRSRSRERRRRDRSRSRERRDRKRDSDRSRKDRSRSRDRLSRDKTSPRRSRDNRFEKKSPSLQNDIPEAPPAPPPPQFGKIAQQMPNLIRSPADSPNRFNDPQMVDTLNKLQELGKKRNPNAFQGDQQNGNMPSRFHNNRGPVGRGGTFRRDTRSSRFDNNDTQTDCCVAIRNAPNHTSYGDVRRFFPFMIDKHGIKMINDNMGRRTGNIYVRFCDNRSKQMSLERKLNELKGAAVTVESLEDSEYEAAVDSFLPFREDNGSPVHVIPDEEPMQSFTVLKLSDLPLFVKEHDIIKAFTNFSLLSIVLNDCRNTRSKMAYIQFVKPEDAQVALQQKENYVFGRRQPTVEAVSDEEYERIRNVQNDRIPEPTPIAPEIPQDVNVPRDPRQRRQMDNGNGQNQHPMHQPPVGPAFMPTIPNNFPQNAVFGAPFPGPGQVLAGFPGPGAVDPRTAAANWANRPAFPNSLLPHPQQNMPINLEEEVLDCVLMKGLPKGATDRTIVTFLSDTGAVPARIHLMLDTNGLPSGDCFCEFRSTQEARKATSKHGQNLEGCRITVDLVSHSVVEEALEGPKINDQREPTIGNPPPFFEPQRGGFIPRGHFRGRGASDHGFDRGGFRGGYNGFDSRGRGGFDNGRGGYRGRGIWNDRGRGGFDRSRARGYNRGRGGFDGGRGEYNSRDFDSLQFENQEIQPEPDAALENFGAPGCVVSMENVPFRASIDEILEFFSEFELTQDDIIRRYNERGQPTGDARVAFRTPFDAQRAIKTKHMNTIHDRRVGLSLM